MKIRRILICAALVASLLVTCLSIPMGSASQESKPKNILGSIAEGGVSTDLIEHAINTTFSLETVGETVYGKYTMNNAAAKFLFYDVDVVGYDYLAYRIRNNTDKDLAASATILSGDGILADTFVFLDDEGDLVDTYFGYSGLKLPKNFDGYLLIGVTNGTFQGGAAYSRWREDDRIFKHARDGYDIDPCSITAICLNITGTAAGDSVSIKEVSLMNLEGTTDKYPASRLNIKVVNEMNYITNDVLGNIFTNVHGSAKPSANVAVDNNDTAITFGPWDNAAYAVIMFSGLKLGIADYTLGGTVTPYGISMYVKTGDKAVTFTQLRLKSSESASTSHLFCDMDGRLVAINESGAVSIPANSEGYLICRFPAGYDFTGRNEFTYWATSEVGGTMTIDNIGVVTAAPHTLSLLGPDTPARLNMQVGNSFENVSTGVKGDVMYNNDGGAYDGGTAEVIEQTNGNRMMRFTITDSTVIPHVNGGISPIAANTDATGAVGIGFYVKNEGKAFKLGQGRINTNVYLKENVYLYDMDGYLVGTGTSSILIPEGFEGYLVYKFPAESDITTLQNHFTFWSYKLADENPVFCIDNVGLVMGSISTEVRAPENLGLNFVDVYFNDPVVVPTDRQHFDGVTLGVTSTEWFKKGDYGVAFKIKNTTDAAVQWRIRLMLQLEGETGTNGIYMLGSRLFDMNGNEVDPVSSEWAIIKVPANFDGYVLMPFDNVYVESGSIGAGSNGIDVAGNDYTFTDVKSYMVDTAHGIIIQAAAYFGANPEELEDIDLDITGKYNNINDDMLAQTNRFNPGGTPISASTVVNGINKALKLTITDNSGSQKLPHMFNDLVQFPYGFDASGKVGFGFYVETGAKEFKINWIRLYASGLSNSGYKDISIDNSTLYNMDGEAVGTAANIPENFKGYVIVKMSEEFRTTLTNTVVMSVDGAKDAYLIIDNFGFVAGTTPTVTVTANTLTYNGTAQALVAGSTNGGTLQYKLGDGEWGTTVPTAVNAGNYTVYYRVVGNDTYLSTAEASIDVTIAKANATVAAPTANTLTYTGEAQALVAAGTANGGAIQYKLGDGEWGTTIPTATNAGTYTVYYKVVGDANHNDVAHDSVSVTIAKADATVTAPTAKTDLTYTGERQGLINEGTVTGGTFMYSHDGDTWTDQLPGGTSAGSYTVYYKVVGDANHNDVAGGTLTVTIAKANATVTAPEAVEDLVADGTAKALITAGTANGGTIQYKLGDGEWGPEIPTATEAGTYTVYYKVVGDANHNDVQQASVNVTISAPASTPIPTPVETPTPTPVETPTPTPVVTTPAPTAEPTTPPTTNPNTGAVSVMALVAVAVISGGMIVARKKED